MARPPTRSLARPPALATDLRQLPVDAFHMDQLSQPAVAKPTDAEPADEVRKRALPIETGERDVRPKGPPCEPTIKGRVDGSAKKLSVVAEQRVVNILTDDGVVVMYLRMQDVVNERFRPNVNPLGPLADVKDFASTWSFKSDGTTVVRVDAREIPEFWMEMAVDADTKVSWLASGWTTSHLLAESEEVRTLKGRVASLEEETTELKKKCASLDAEKEKLAADFGRLVSKEFKEGLKEKLCLAEERIKELETKFLA